MLVNSNDALGKKKKKSTKIKQSHSECFQPTIPFQRKTIPCASQAQYIFRKHSRKNFLKHQLKWLMNTQYYLWRTYREALSNTHATCQIHLSSRSEREGLELHHTSSSSHITSVWKAIATVTEAKHSIHSKPQTRTAISFIFYFRLAGKPCFWNWNLLKADGNSPSAVMVISLPPYFH